jgi:hypothetical protein
MSGEEFTRDACRTVVAQLCEAVDCIVNVFSFSLCLSVDFLCGQVGFHAMQQSASETLTDVLIKFLDEVGFQSHSLAELAGRTVCFKYRLLVFLAFFCLSALSVFLPLHSIHPLHPHLSTFSPRLLARRVSCPVAVSRLLSRRVSCPVASIKLATERPFIILAT